MKTLFLSREAMRPQIVQRKKIVILFLLAFGMFLIPKNAFATPSYARQTGMACSACHTVYPQLNSFGRSFKLNGYTLTGIKTITDDLTEKDKETVKNYLRILSISPLSGMFQGGFTSLKTAIPNTQNNNIEFPQQFSLFYAGQVTPKIGTFIQLTLNNATGGIKLDNTDIRYADQFSAGDMPITYGFSLNNNPTVQDLWNTTPAWGYPYTSSGVAPIPGSNPIISSLGGTVAGLGAYTMINNLLYLELSGYRTAQMGAALPPDATVSGAVYKTSPYWRAALQKAFGKSYFEVGTFGMSNKLYTLGVTGLTNDYTDVAMDLQYEYQLPKGQFTLHTSYINEKQQLNSSFSSGASQNLDNNLRKFNLDASVYFKPSINLTAGYFATNGSTDTVLYAPSQISGSSAGAPDSKGMRFQLDYIPWGNTQFSVNYISYSKFNGGTTNYDGFGRNASDNNAIYLQLWFAF